MSKFMNLFLVIMFAVTSVGCGDMFMSKSDDEKDYSQFATCEFDVLALSKILTENIKGDLLCLESNLSLFIQVVKSDKPGHLPYDSLKTYLVNNVDNITEETLGIIKAIFELNSLIFGDEVEYIKKENVSKIAEILIDFNRIFIDGRVYANFTSNQKVSFSVHNQRKSKIYSSLAKIGELISDAMVENNNKIIIADFIERFKTKENKQAITYVESLLFIKKAILGGDEKILTHKELKRLVNLIGDVGKVSYDFVNLPDTRTQINEEEEVLKILKEDIETAYNNFYYKNSTDEVIVTYTQILDLVGLFTPQYVKYIKYKDSFLKIKEILLESNSEDFTAVEISLLLTDVLYKNISKGVFVYRSFNNNVTILDRAKKIWYSLLDIITFNSHEEEYIVDFKRVIRDYRFYQGSSFSPLYDHDYVRNPRGLFDILLYEDITRRFFAHYGELDYTATGDYVMTQELFLEFMKDFGGLLEGEGYLLPGRAANTTETIALMTSLFHAQSNGDGRIEIPEFVEFVITLTTSLNLSSAMEKYMLARCEKDKKGRVHPGCYRENFIDFLDHQLENGNVVSSYLPGLANYLAEMETDEEAEEYLISTSKFSRVCTTFNDGTEVPMKHGDFFVSWAGLLAVEQSMLRYDVDGSGILEPKEVIKAYDIYKSAVEGMIPVEFLKKYSKTFFLYLVKYKRVPEIPEITGLRSIWRAIREGYHFVKFIFKSQRNKEADADRMTFAAVLRIIAENSPANKENPYPCETLR